MLKDMINDHSSSYQCFSLRHKNSGKFDQNKALNPPELPSQTRASRRMDEDMWLMKASSAKRLTVNTAAFRNAFSVLSSTKNKSLHLICCFHMKTFKPSKIQHISLLQKSHLGKEIALAWAWNSSAGGRYRLLRTAHPNSFNQSKNSFRAWSAYSFSQAHTGFYCSFSQSELLQQKPGNSCEDALWFVPSLDIRRPEVSLMKDLVSFLLLLGHNSMSDLNQQISPAQMSREQLEKKEATCFRHRAIWVCLWQWLFRAFNYNRWIETDNLMHHLDQWATHSTSRLHTLQLISKSTTFWASPDRAGFENDVEL